jgi:predicted neuraminidase
MVQTTPTHDRHGPTAVRLRHFMPVWLSGAALLAALVATDDRTDHATVPLAPIPRWELPQHQPAESWQRLVARHETGFSHSPTIVEHDNGELQAVWFHGVREAHPSVGLWTSRRPADGEWSAPSLLLDRRDDMAALGYRIHTIGNPVLFAHPGGETWLFYVNPSIGGWSTARTALRRSSDRGLTWSPPVQLPTGPFLSMSTLVRATPRLLENGVVALPAYHELMQRYSEFLLINESGRLVGRRFIANGLQANLAYLPDGAWLALLRPLKHQPPRLHLAESRDGGLSWSPSRPVDLVNPHQPVCALTLNDGSTLFGYNPQERGRNRIAFIHIDGETGQWRRLPHLIDPGGEDDETAYCTAIQKRNGDIVVIYADPPNHRILEFGLTPAWLTAQIAESELVEP